MITQSINTAMPAIKFVIPENRWSDDDAAGKSRPEILLYRSNLLGSDLSVTNFGGGNTSAKLREPDPLTGEKVEVLWVKGSGGDIGSMKLNGFATLYQEKLRGLQKHYCGEADDDKMVGYLQHCTFNLNSRAASIDTSLHSLLPFDHIDHVHPDAIIALAASTGGEMATKEIWNSEIGWLPWKRPGYTLALQLRDYVVANPDLRGVVLAGHGIICWADTAKACYDNTIALIADAAKFLNEKLGDKPAFGGVAIPPNADRRNAIAELAPKLRGLMVGARSKVAHFSDAPETLEFVGSKDFERLAAIGTSCPDHFLRTKIAPLTLDPARLADASYLEASLVSYRAAYAAYYKRSAGPKDPPMRDANPVVVLVPGIGMLTFAANKTTARLASEFYANAINVMRGAEAIGDYVGLDERDAFNIEYWALEEAKLQRMPKPRPLAGKVAVVTGAASGIGSASAERLLSDGACVMLLDLNAKALEEKQQQLVTSYGGDCVRVSICDVTNEMQVQAAFAMCAVEFGGLDIFVANAGIASSAPIEKTSRELWRSNYNVLAEGYFLTSRAAFPLMKCQGGGSIIFICSKNALAAGKDAAAYSSAKAAALHLGRCLAFEGAEHGIRVNTVNPDAVIKGSKIWDGNWREERANFYGVDSGEELEAHYRNRSMLKRDVLPEDVAEAVYYFATDMSAKSTGNILNVDAGNAQSFTR